MGNGYLNVFGITVQALDFELVVFVCFGLNAVALHWSGFANVENFL